jgi:hypothetical protein
MQILFSSPVSLIAHFVTEATGRIAGQFSSEEFVQQARIIVGAVERSVAFDTAVLRADTVVLRAVKRRGAVTLLAERIARLIQQTLVGAAVGAVAGNTAAVALGAE